MISNGQTTGIGIQFMPIKMSPRFVLGRENVPCVAEVVNRSLKADYTDFTNKKSQIWGAQGERVLELWLTV